MPETPSSTDDVSAAAKKLAEDLIARVSNPPEAVRRDLATLNATDNLAVSLIALRFALEALSRAPGALGLPDANGDRTEACELRDRVVAASRLIAAAIDQVATDGNALVNSVKEMLGVK